MEQRSREAHELVRANRVAITAVVATYNEEAHIGPCLMSLLNQQGLDGDLEILVVDGGSTDRTVQIVRSFPGFGEQIRLLSNRRRLQVYAWNLALNEARGEYYAMIGAHAEYSPTYLANCLTVMNRTGAAGVGGIARAYGDGAMGGAIAWCMSSPFGVGNARFRYAEEEQETDSVFALFTTRQRLVDLGGFDESLPFDEDSDLNYRMRERGGKIVMSPAIQVKYAARASLKGLWKQMYRYGYFRRFTQRKHRGRVPARTYIPAALLGGLALSAVLAGVTPLRPFAALVPTAYALFLLAASLRAAGTTRLGSVYVPVALATMHIAYGWGWWSAALAGLRPLLRRAPRTA
jgi:succinoglycan biosynthesis protein ExoA